MWRAVALIAALTLPRSAWASTASAAISLPADERCSVTMLSPLDNFAIVNDGVVVAATVYVRSDPSLFPFVTCIASMDVLSNDLRTKCFGESQFPANGHEAAVIQVNVDVQNKVSGGEGEYVSIVFGVPAATTDAAYAVISDALLSPNGGSGVGCVASSTYYVMTRLTEPWWVEYMRPEPSQPRIAEAVAHSAAARQLYRNSAAADRVTGLLDAQHGWLTAFRQRPPLSLRGLPHLLGPAPPAPVPVMAGDAAAVSPRSILVAVFSGAKSKHLVDANVNRLYASASAAGMELTVLLCVYDGSNWDDIPWTVTELPGLNFLMVRVKRQMKWWYVKRFVTPLTVNPDAYDYVMILDADVELPRRVFDLADFLRIMHEYGVMMAQPAHAVDSSGTYNILAQPENHQRYAEFIMNEQTQMLEDAVRAGKGERASPSVTTPRSESAQAPRDDNAPYQAHSREVEGRWSTFVECGPVAVFNTRVWACVWDLLQPDLVSGYGYDLVWVSACAPHNAAIIDAHVLHHVNQREASTGGNFNSYGRMVAESVVLFRRLADRNAWNRDTPADIQVPAATAPFKKGERREYRPPA